MGSVHGVMGIVGENGLCDPVQIMDKAVCISFHANILGKGMHLAMDK